MQKKTSLTNITKLPQLFLPFLKKNWKYFAVAAVTVAALSFFQKDRSSLIKQIQTTRESYEERISKIEAARKEERDQNDKALIQLKKDLEEVQKQYDAAKIELEKKKKEEIKELVDLYADDPEELAKKLSEVTGFKIILPE